MIVTCKLMTAIPHYMYVLIEYSSLHRYIQAHKDYIHTYTYRYLNHQDDFSSELR